MPLVAGVDSSTQSTKVEVRDLAGGEVVARTSAPHTAVTPPRSEQDPESWWTAFADAWARATADLGGREVVAVSVAGQQHGMVALDADDRPIHPAKLWNDTESAADAAWLLGRLGGSTGGPRWWADAVGSVPLAAFTVTKLSWLHRTHPDAWQRMARVLLPHDYLTMRLTGSATTDRGDASGTGYFSAATGEYRFDVLAAIDADRDWSGVLPAVLGPLEVAGEWNGMVVGVGTGDNMAAALGLGLGAGDASLSIGTSGTAFMVSDTPTADALGEVAGFADATGRFLPLVCTSNAAKVIDAVARLLGTDHDEFDRLAGDAGSGGPVLLPYLDGERTPNRPDATGVLTGLRSDVTRAQVARAAVDGVACGLVDALDALHRCGLHPERVVLTGGGARSQAMCRTLAGMIEAPTVVTTLDEAVAAGAAVQAAAAYEGVEHAVIQRRWGLGGGREIEDPIDPGDLRERYAAVRDA